MKRSFLIALVVFCSAFFSMPCHAGDTRWIFGQWVLDVEETLHRNPNFEQQTMNEVRMYAGENSLSYNVYTTAEQRNMVTTSAGHSKLDTLEITVIRDVGANRVEVTLTSQVGPKRDYVWRVTKRADGTLLVAAKGSSFTAVLRPGGAK